MPELNWMHEDDGTLCRPAASKATGSWLCIDHERPVLWSSDPVAPLVIYPEGSALAGYVSEGMSLVEQAARAAGVPEELLPKEGERSGDIGRMVREVWGPEIDRQEEAVESFTRRVVQHIPAEEHEALARRVVEMGLGTLKLVGWYCAGGHEVKGHDALHIPPIASPSLRFDDPCEYGVPVYIVERTAPRVPLDGTISLREAASRLGYDLDEIEVPSREELRSWQEPKHASGGSTATRATMAATSDAPCEGCGSHLAQCTQGMQDVEGRPCCRDCEHPTP